MFYSPWQGVVFQRIVHSVRFISSSKSSLCHHVLNATNTHLAQLNHHKCTKQGVCLCQQMQHSTYFTVMLEHTHILGENMAWFWGNMLRTPSEFFVSQKLFFAVSVFSEFLHPFALK